MISVKTKQYKELPISIIGSVAFLTLIGLVVLKSISQHQGGGFLNNPFNKQLLILLPALCLALFIFILPRFTIHKYAYPFYFLGIIIISLPFFGPSHANTFRWLDIGLPFNIQPSEFAKVFTTIALARYLSDHTIQMKKFHSILVPIGFVLVPSLIVMKQPDLGTSIVMLIPVLPMLYWSGARPFYLFLMIAPIFSMLTAFQTVSFTVWAIILGCIIIGARQTMIMSIILFFGNIFLGLISPLAWNSLSSYQQGRIISFLNPEKDPLGVAYQVIQSKTAIGSGGIFGKGWGAGTQTHLKFLPVQESDFILSVMGEEMGFIMVASILLLMGYLIVQVLKRAFLSKDRFSSLALIGIASILLAHAFINTAMTVGLIPVKGLPFPFISAGGSFLITSYMMVGLVINLSVNYSD